MRNSFFLFFFFVLSACTASKLSLHNKENDTAVLKTDTRSGLVENSSLSVVDKSVTDTNSDAVSSLEKIEKLTAEFEAILKTYDTAQPVNPLTGTPPLQSELLIANRKTVDTRNAANQFESLSVNQQNDIHSQLKAEKKETNETAVFQKQTTQTQSDSLSQISNNKIRWLFIAAIVVLVALLIFPDLFHKK